MNRREAILAGVAALLGAPLVAKAKPGILVGSGAVRGKSIPNATRPEGPGDELDFWSPLIIENKSLVKRSGDAGVA